MHTKFILVHPQSKGYVLSFKYLVLEVSLIKYPNLIITQMQSL